MNLYGFADGDPVNFSDPFGLCPWCLGAIGGVVTGYAIARLTGDDYGWADAATDAALGAVGGGLLGKLGQLRKIRHFGRFADGVGDVQINNARLRNAVGKLFQPSDKLPGGTAGAIRYTQRTGKLVGGSDHIQAGRDRLRQLEKILGQEDLSTEEQRLVRELINDLTDALRDAKPRR